MDNYSCCDHSREIEEEKEDTEDRAYWLSEGKHEINKLLWTFLPPSTTLKKADAIACEIYALISKEWLQ